MDFNLKIGIEGTLKTVVRETDTAIYIGSGDLEVLGTPILVNLMENTAKSSIGLHLNKEDTTVGIEINVKHLKPSKIGSNIKIYSKLIDIVDRKLYFKLEAYDDFGQIGEGNHIRVIVNRKKFINKLI